jgi:hypothetical protein
VPIRHPTCTCEVNYEASVPLGGTDGINVCLYLLQYGKQLRENYRAFKNKQQMDSITCSVPSVSVM